MEIDDVLKELRNRTIYYKPNPGNGGDALIAHAAFCLFKKHKITYRIIQGEENLTDKIVLYAGGGNLVPLYDDCANFIAQHHEKARRLILLPHTISGHEELLKSLGKNVLIICREKRSFAYLAKFKNVQSCLIKDLALYLQFPTDFSPLTKVHRLAHVVPKRSLISNVLRNHESLGSYLKSYRKRSRLHAFRKDSEKTFDVPQGNIDLSELINHDYSMLDEEKVRDTASAIFYFLDQFEEVHTNRLHICIAAAILGKKVYFYGNSYWKNESVYDFSLKDSFPNVKWMGYEYK